MQTYRLNVYTRGEARYSISKTVRFANCFQPTHALPLLVQSQAQKNKKRNKERKITQGFFSDRHLRWKITQKM